MSREILKNIIDEFDPEKFIRFFREKNREFTPRTEELTVYNDDNFSNCTRIGKIDFPEGSNMIVCSLNTDKSLTERSGKKSQYEKGKKILKDTQSDSGIFIYYDNAGNFRFSLIYANYLGNKRDWSIFKRFTYFVSKEFTNKTFIQRIGDSDFSSLENIKDAFSVEKVNKEFYKEIAIKFSELVGGQRVIKSKVEKFRPLIKLPGTDDHQKLQEFAVRMIGRIVFCWFLKKKKSQNGIPLIPENLLSGSAVEKNKNYYHSVLEKLFFEILNTKQEERKKFKGFELYKDIPFLNGGLFEPQDDDLYKLSLLNSLIIPDKWLAEFFNILESYNFTIDENTSIDVELSIDPEMLGRIFENLLAEINPETGESARKSTGSYYTPRPIVEYMVDESLKQYLITKTDIPESKLSMLLSYSSEEAEITDKESVKIINALDEIKILDPACGSGAFPIGILQKMLLILQKIDKKSSKWLEKKLNKIESSVLKKELKEKFKNENLDYIRKLGLIQDSIYGVDIQSIAVEISKLRCFLTLIVDEDVDDKKPNRGIIPLPNLEFKFVAANTLISLPEEEGSLFDESEYIKQLEELRDEFFTSYGQKKLEMESDYLSIQEEMVKKLLRNGVTGGRAFQLASWFPFSNEKAEWFDPKWMFGVSEGFDIVCGNPPYGIKINKTNNPILSELFKAILKGEVETYILFYYKGLNLLSTNGFLSFITPDSWFSNKGAAPFRLWLSNNHSIIDVFDFYKPFEGAKDTRVHTVLISAKKISSIISIKQIHPSNKELIYREYKIPHIIISTFKEQEWRFYITNSERKIFDKMEMVSKPLESLYNIKYGLRTGNNNKYITSKETKYPLIAGSDIASLFQVKWKPKYLKNTNGLPASYFNEYFSKEKIIVQRIRTNSSNILARWLECALVIGNYIPLDSLSYIFIKTNDFRLEYLLGVLNSFLINKYYRSYYTDVNVKPTYLAQIPIPPVDNKSQSGISKIVAQITELKLHSKETIELENQIDVMVYKLYKLTYDEVKIVDPEFWMSEGEYEEFDLN